MEHCNSPPGLTGPSHLPSSAEDLLAQKQQADGPVQKVKREHCLGLELIKVSQPSCGRVKPQQQQLGLIQMVL